MTDRILITQETHKMWGKTWVSTTATDTLGVVDPVAVTSNGTKPTAKDRARAMAIMRDTLEAQNESIFQSVYNINN